MVRPPPEHRFGKGKLPRRKAGKHLPKPADEIRKVLRRTITVTIGGNSQKIQIVEALMRRLREAAMSGKVRPLNIWMKLQEQAAAAQPPRKDIDGEAVMASVLAKLKRNASEAR